VHQSAIRLTRSLTSLAETCRRELHEKREHTTKLEQKYSLAKRLRRELEERQIQFAEAAESALEQKAHSDRRRAAAERERDDAIVRAVAAVHECEAVKKDLEKIPSMETLRKEVHTYKALADHHSREVSLSHCGCGWHTYSVFVAKEIQGLMEKA
jgi:hypothetical protein